MFDAGLLLTLLVNCGQCNDVRLGDNIALMTFPWGGTLVNVARFSLLTPLSGDERILLYNSGTNHSTDKYVLAADFYSITVKSVTVSDGGEYISQVTHIPFGSHRTVTADTTITVYGKQNLTQCVGRKQ